jgi:acyl carrier protein
MAIERELERFVVETLARRRGKKAVRPEDDLICDGVIDSLGLVELIAFIERQFVLTINDEDVVIRNFRSMRNIQRFIDDKRLAVT